MKFNIYPYNEWETFINGMYKTIGEIDNYEKYTKLSKNLLLNEQEFLLRGLEMISVYKKSCETFLNNKSINKIAFIGQSTCNFFYGSPEICTKEAFKSLSFDQQNKANKIANKILYEYKEKYRKIYFKVEQKRIFN